MERTERKYTVEGIVHGIWKKIWKLQDGFDDARINWFR